MSAADLAEIPAARRAGVAEDVITTARQQWAREHRRPRALSAREALLVLRIEAAIVWLIGCDVRNGKAVPEGDWARLVVALRRIDTITDEAVG